MFERNEAFMIVQLSVPDFVAIAEENEIFESRQHCFSVYYLKLHKFSLLRLIYNIITSDSIMTMLFIFTSYLSVLWLCQHSLAPALGSAFIVVIVGFRISPQNSCRNDVKFCTKEEKYFY